MQVKKMYSRINTQILTWAGDEPLQIAYDGQNINVPPMTETARTGGSSIYRFESARDGKGELIPGTLLLKDVTVQRRDGSYKRALQVTDVCDYLTTQRDDLFQRGFNIVGTPQEVAEALEAGRPLYEASQDERARALLASELERRKKFEAKGQPAPPREDEHNITWAIQHLRARAASKPKASVEDIRAALEGEYAPTPKSAVTPPRKVSAQEIFEEAQELGVVLTKNELTGLLTNDKELTAFVLEKIKLRKEAAASPA